MGEALLLPDRPHPQDGDIVILGRSSSDQKWSLLRQPGPAQIEAQSRQQAMAIARSIAPELGVDVWFLEAGVYSLFETHRRYEGDSQRSKAGRSTKIQTQRIVDGE
jgi:hypothetical protein